MSEHRPEVFFRLIHPKENSRGEVILERFFGDRGSCQSSIPPNKLAHIASKAYLVPDMFFSVARFSGRRILLNFEQTSAIYAQIPSDLEDPKNLIGVYNYLDKGHIPLPTSIIDDGTNLTLFWVLKTPLYRNELYKAYLLQKSISRFIAKKTGRINYLDVNFTTRLIGTLNTSTDKLVSLARHTGNKLSNTQIDKVLLKMYEADEFQTLQKHWTVTQELLALFSDRIWTNASRRDLFNDWLIYFGSALCHFGPPSQIKMELSAIAESLEGKQWITIKNNYHNLITAIAENAKKGFIKIENQHFTVNHDDWGELIKGRLEITQQEIDQLGLYTLAGASHRLQPPLIRHSRLQTVGSDQFIPVEKLLKNFS